MSIRDMPRLVPGHTLEESHRASVETVMIVALCDMTEVSSNDKYDSSMTLASGVRARPSPSIDSCSLRALHNERVTPPVAVS